MARRNRFVDWLGGMAFLLACTLVPAGVLCILGALVRTIPLSGLPLGIAWMLTAFAAVASGWLFARWLFGRLNRRIP